MVGSANGMLSSVTFYYSQAAINNIKEYYLFIYHDTQQDNYVLRVVPPAEEGIFLEYNFSSTDTIEISESDWVKFSSFARAIFIRVTDANGIIYMFTTPPNHAIYSDYSEKSWTYHSPTDGTIIFYMRRAESDGRIVARLAKTSVVGA